MPNYLEALLGRVDDPDLADALRSEIERLKDSKQFGLVFERHMPETVRLHSHPVRRGLSVQDRSKSGDHTTWIVQKVSAGEAAISREENGLKIVESRPVHELVVVRQFGEPIYPGLKSVGRIEKGGSKPFHAIINAENYHALETMLYAYEGKVDCIYIDPPYNTGAKDWRYNNDYVDANDGYRHSKWLAFMERRLVMAKKLLNPADSMLIVAIDENEYARLYMLLEQVFPQAAITTVSVVINPKGTPDAGFARVEEYLIFLAFGSATPSRVLDSMHGTPPSVTSVRVRWRGLTRTGSNGVRSKSPGAYFPIFIRTSDGTIAGSGDVPPVDSDGSDVVPPEGTVAVWPTPRPDGTLGRWSVVKAKFDELLEQGAVKTGRVNIDTGEFPLWYLTDPNLKSIETGEIVVRGKDENGALIVEYADAASKKSAPKTVWSRASHSASEYGSGMLTSLLPDREFSYPKSLYAVEDAIRLAVVDKPDAMVIDFFGGSGTTTHAVMRLNRQDDGQRRSITVTNNEIGPEAEKELLGRGLVPGDEEWESLGIFGYITRPRIEAAVTGKVQGGASVVGEYKYTDEFAISEGLEENVEFFELTYEDRDRISLGRAFHAIAPILWMKSGSKGPRVDALPKDAGWALPHGATYGVLFDMESWREFVEAVSQHEHVRHAFVITDSVSAFQQVVAELPATVEATQLYDDFLSSFEINTGRGENE